MNLVPKEILMSHLQRAEGAEEVTLPIDFFRDLLYQAMPQQRTCQDLIDEAVKAEREACAKLCEVIAQKMEDEGEGPTGNIGWVDDCVEAIRARGQA
jgi:hypothetical protein